MSKPKSDIYINTYAGVNSSPSIYFSGGTGIDYDMDNVNLDNIALNVNNENNDPYSIGNHIFAYEYVGEEDGKKKFCTNFVVDDNSMGSFDLSVLIDKFGGLWKNDTSRNRIAEKEITDIVKKAFNKDNIKKDFADWYAAPKKRLDEKERLNKKRNAVAKGAFGVAYAVTLGAMVLWLKAIIPLFAFISGAIVVGAIAALPFIFWWRSLAKKSAALDHIPEEQRYGYNRKRAMEKVSEYVEKLLENASKDQMKQFIAESINTIRVINASGKEVEVGIGGKVWKSNKCECLQQIRTELDVDKLSGYKELEREQITIASIHGKRNKYKDNLLMLNNNKFTGYNKGTITNNNPITNNDPIPIAIKKKK